MQPNAPVGAGELCFDLLVDGHIISQSYIPAR